MFVVVSCSPGLLVGLVLTLALSSGHELVPASGRPLGQDVLVALVCYHNLQQTSTNIQWLLSITAFKGMTTSSKCIYSERRMMLLNETPLKSGHVTLKYVNVWKTLLFCYQCEWGMQQFFQKVNDKVPTDRRYKGSKMFWCPKNLDIKKMFFLPKFTFFCVTRLESRGAITE